MIIVDDFCGPSPSMIHRLTQEMMNFEPPEKLSQDLLPLKTIAKVYGSRVGPMLEVIKFLDIPDILTMQGCNKRTYS